MGVPPEFNEFVMRFYDMPPKDPQEQEAWFDFKIECVQPKDRIVVRDFIKLLIDRRVDPYELKKLWSEGGAVFSLPNVHDLTTFYQALEDRLTKKIEINR
jgi:hypothetical protein